MGDDETISSTPRHTAGVVVVGFSPLYRNELTALMNADAGLDLLDTVGFDNALITVTRLQPDAVVLDASTRAGLVLARELKAEFPHLPLVGFSVSECVKDAVAWANAGVSTFVEKNAVDSLIEAVRNAVSGTLSCPSNVTQTLYARLASLTDDTSTFQVLTAPEVQIAGLVAKGLSNQAIAKALRISPTTVKNHNHTILEKLKAGRRARQPAERRPRA